MAESGASDCDVLIIGAGILGVTLAYWLSVLYECSIAIADTSLSAGAHTSSRNTGVIHRPFYLDPRRKRTFARTSDVSLPMWRDLARGAGLPWRQIGTFNVALSEPETNTVGKYRRWGLENGMGEQELQLLDGGGVRALEPEVSCRAALLSKTDVSVDFGAFTRHIMRLLVARGAKFLGGHRAISVRRRDGQTKVECRTQEGPRTLRCRFLVNAAGGGSLEIAHACGLALDHAALNFRGEYWVVDGPFASRVTSNIYRPPRFPQYPFLDPHFVVRADGSRQIGPNAVIVPGPYVYSGVGLGNLDSYLRRPVEPKGRLFLNSDFLTLLAGEWRSSLSKGAMCERVRKFVPGLETSMLNRRAVFGVRSSVVNGSGFVPEAMVLRGERSVHIVNFNSPGATGAPAYSAMVVDELRSQGELEELRPNPSPRGIAGWDFAKATELVRAAV
jgi:L-2-hydroxyglutarate oxidase